ncbi:S-(hydroxymethyl)glutathione synthase [Shewanella morhuae]|uniref:S-(hydroxymethyl)glutathione synthase n=1 Tax=Shewanella morhuae TaxID=365591 RepID=UPI0035935093
MHPQVDNGIVAGRDGFSGGYLFCKCSSKPLKLPLVLRLPTIMFAVVANVGSQKEPCFSVAVVARDKVSVTENSHKLIIIDESATIQRYACKECGTHMFGRIENTGHPFHGLDFVHTELSSEQGWSAPEFAAFVSSIIESGAAPESMGDVRNTLKELGLEPYDCLSPVLMDAIATHIANNG